MRAARLLDRTPWRYGLRIAATVLFFVACWWAFVAIGDSWLVLGPAALLGLASTQVAFLAHEGGHQQITATRTGNCVQHRIPYTETGLFASYACALRYLQTLGEPLRASQLTRNKA